MKKLIRIAERQGIEIVEYDLGTEILGIYIRTLGSPPVIGLHIKLPYSSSLTRCILSEELGHHFTMTGNVIYQHAKYGDRIQVGKIEKLALRWAGKLLIPDEDLYKALKHGQPSIYELAQIFNVTEDFARTRLQIFKEEEYALRHGTLYQRLKTTAYLAGSFSALLWAIDIM